MTFCRSYQLYKVVISSGDGGLSKFNAMETIERLKIKKAGLDVQYDLAIHDTRFRNICFVAGGNSSKSSYRYRVRHREKLCRIIDERNLCARAIKIVEGKPFMFDEVEKCRLEIMHYNREYDRPLPMSSPVVDFSRIVRLTFRDGYKSVLKKYPVILDFEDRNGIYIVSPDDKIIHKWPELDDGVYK